MLDKIKKALFLGIGVISLTTKEIDKKVRKLVKDKILTEKEGKEIFRKLVAEVKKQKKRVEKISGAKTRGELRKLIKRIGSLEKSIRELARKEIRKGAKTILKKTKKKK